MKKKAKAKPELRAPEARTSAGTFAPGVSGNPCTALEDCDRPVEKSGLCAGHRKQKQRGQPFTPLAVNRGLPADSPHRLSYHEAMVQAALELADCDAEDDTRWERLVGALRRAAIRFAKQAVTQKIREGMERRAAAGLPLGRPVKVGFEQASEAVRIAGGVRAGARSLGVSYDAVRRALVRKVG